MAFSEKEWVARLESQLRDESVFLQSYYTAYDKELDVIWNKRKI